MNYDKVNGHQAIKKQNYKDEVVVDDLMFGRAVVSLVNMKHHNSSS